MEELYHWLQTHQIEWVECVAIDYSGLGRGKLIAVNSLSPSYLPRLPLDIFSQTIDGQYAQVTLDGERRFNEEDADFAMLPDQATVRLVPWLRHKTASVICDGQDLQGNAIDISPRAALARVLELYKEQGWQPIVAPELEFFIFQPLKRDQFEPEVVTGQHHNQSGSTQPYGLETTRRS